MEFHVSNFLALALLAGLFIIALLYTSRRGRKNNSNSKPLPPVVPGARPLIGHLRQLTSGEEPLVRTLGQLADKYGPIFTVRIGMQPHVIISSWETARDCFSTNDKLLADRPPGCAGKYLGYDYAVLPFALHGPYWRKMRKLVVVELLSNNTLDKLKPVWMSELEVNIKELYTLVKLQKLNNRKFNMSDWFGHLTLNLIVKLIGGRRYKYRPNDSAAEEEADEEARCMSKVFKEIMRLVGEFAQGDAFFPAGLVRWLDFGGQIAAMKRVSKAMDDILQNWIEDHVKRREERGNDDVRDFIDVMLSVIDHDFQSGHSYTRETIIKAASLSMLQDAADTLGLNLEWILSLLLNNPHAMKKAQGEIDTIVGKERWVEESDIENLPYLQAAVKEAMRLYPAAPLLVPHRAIEECIVGGYTIPKGTILYANAWKIQRDSRVWPEPEKFLPERFLASREEMDTPSRHFGFIPFGIGRRSCPGISYSLKSMLQDAADTLGLNLEWILSLLLNNPHAMKKAQGEIDTIVGKERWVEESDIENLPYLQAAVKEAMRLYPAAPLLVPHRAIEECIVGGYTIPKGTILYANAWKIQRDSRVWPEPEKFLPERFLASREEMDTPSRHFGFIPFGIGRRSCPGISYSLKVTHLSIGRLVQGFDVTTPLNMPVDMSEGQATTLPRATPLEVNITPRLPPSFYGEM